MIFLVPEVVIFEHRDCNGLQRRFNVEVINLGIHEAFINWEWAGSGSHNHTKVSWAALGVSSVMVISGTWQFYEQTQYGTGGRVSPPVPPGAYSYVELPEFGMINDQIGSFRPISDQPQGDGYRWH